MNKQLIRTANVLPFLLLLAVANLNTAVATPPPRSGGALTTQFDGKVFSATLKSGYHFNEKAPNRIQIGKQDIKPTTLSHLNMVFTSLPKKLDGAYAALYICDDAVTFCEYQRFELSQTLANTNTEVVKKQPSKPNKFGFIEDDFTHALKQAQASNKLVLIDFSARWCPGCVRFESETFGTRFFKSLTKDIIKVKLDMDRFENTVIADKYGVKAIPTLILIDKNQKEISRLVDYQPDSVLREFFNDTKSNPIPIENLLKSEKTTTQHRLTLGRRLCSSGKAEQALVYLEQVKPEPPELKQCRLDLALQLHKDGKLKTPQLVEQLKDMIQQEPYSTRSITWRQHLATHDRANRAKVIMEGLALADSLLKNKDLLKSATQGDLVGEFTGFEPLLVSLHRTYLAEVSEDSEMIQKSWDIAYEVGRSLKINPKNHGPALRYLIVMVAAKKFQEADMLSQILLKVDPQNWDVMRRRLRVLVELKKYNEAINIGKKALENSYGRNEFWVVEYLAKAMIEAKKIEDATQLLDSYLSRPEADWSNMKSSKQKLVDLRKTI